MSAAMPDEGRVFSPAAVLPRESPPHPPLRGTFSPLRGAKGKGGAPSFPSLCCEGEGEGGGRPPPFLFAGRAKEKGGEPLFPSPRRSTGRRCPGGADEGDF